MAKFTDNQIERLREDLSIAIDILSSGNDFTILDFEAGFDLPPNTVKTILRSPYYTNKLGLNAEQKKILSLCFNVMPNSIMKLTEELIIDKAPIYEYIGDKETVSATVTTEECLDIFRYLTEKGISISYAGLGVAAKRHAFREELLPYIEMFSKRKDSRQSL